MTAILVLSAGDGFRNHILGGRDVPKESCVPILVFEQDLLIAPCRGTTRRVHTTDVVR